MNVIELKGVGKVFKDGPRPTVALRNISLQIKPGEMLAIMGPSGSGKSTLLNIVGLLDVSSSGKYYIDNGLIARQNDHYLAKVRREKIGFVFQSFNLLGRLTLAQNIELPMIYRQVRAKERRKRARELLASVGLKGYEKYTPNQISQGQAQRAAIARALANQPSLILADEPTGNLDTKSSEVVMDIFKKLNKAGATLVIVTHNPEIAAYAHRTVVIRDGQIVRGAKK